MVDRDEISAVLVRGLRRLRPELGDREIRGEEHLIGDLGLDSFARVELMLLFEEALGLTRGEIDPRAFLEEQTLGALVEQIATIDLAATSQP